MEKKVVRLWLPQAVTRFLARRIRIILFLCPGPILFLKIAPPLPWAFAPGGTSWDIKIKNFGSWAAMVPCSTLDFNLYRDFSCLGWISIFWFSTPKCIPIPGDKLRRLPIWHKMQKWQSWGVCFLEKQNDEKKLDSFL